MSEYRQFDGKLKVLSEEKKFLYNVEVWLLNNLTNRNNWRYENLEKHVLAFEETPILCAYPNGKIGDGHNFDIVRDRKTGEEYASFTDSDAERIVGWFAPGSIRMENKDGVDWIVGKGRVWAYYNRELVDNLTVQGGEGMDVSIETMVMPEHITKDGDTEVFDAYEVLGTTILGRGVTPAVAGASIRALSDMSDKLNSLKLRVASYIEKDDDKPDAKKKTDKGVHRPMSKKLFAELGKLFPNHKVVDASADGMNVILCSVSDGDVVGYTFGENDNNTVIDTKFQRVNATVSMKFADGYETEIALDSVVETLSDRVAELNAKLECETKAREDAQNALADMKAKEKNRRKNAAKAAIRAELAEINADLEQKIDEKICEEIDTEIENGEYENAEDENGEWCGDQKACSALKAKAMDSIKEMNRKANASNKKVHVWDVENKDHQNNTNSDIDALLNY